MKTFEIKNCEINVKRFYLPVSFDVKCMCGKISNINLEQDYISYPVVGEPEKIYWYCNGCDTEHDFNINLKIAIDVDCNYMVDE